MRAGFLTFSLHGGGELRENERWHGKRKATRKCSTVGAPWSDWRGCTLTAVGVGRCERHILRKKEVTQ